MKKIILALIVLLTNTIVSSQVSTFSHIEGYTRNVENSKEVYETLNISGKAYHTYKPDSVIDEPFFYGYECIIFVYDDGRKDNISFLPIRDKEYTDSSVIYDCYNDEIEMKITYNEKENIYSKAFYFDYKGELTYAELVFAENHKKQDE